MELSLTLAEYLTRAALLHTRLCPRQVLGVRMARLACVMLDVDPVLERKALYVFMEIGRCAADAVMVVTTASPTNGLMQLMNYGKVAATFVKRCTSEAIRISERPNSRDQAITLLPNLSPWEAQRDAYQIMPDEQLFRWEPVRLCTPLPIIPEKHAVTCQRCGDRVNEHAEVIRDGQTLCKACAFGAYFTPITRSAYAEVPDSRRPDRQACSH